MIITLVNPKNGRPFFTARRGIRGKIAENKEFIMKNRILFFILFSFAAMCLFADDYVADIKDYFPCTIGDSWTYANDSGRIIDRRNVIFKTQDKSDNTPLYVIEHDVQGVDMVANSYSVKDNYVVFVSQKGIRGDEKFFYQPFPVELAPPYQEWTFFDNSAGIEFYYKTYKGVCTVGKTVYNDCIIVEERMPIIEKNKKDVFRVRKSYFAKGVGLVLVTEVNGKKEVTIKKLASITLSIARFWDFEQASNGLVITKYLGDFLPGSLPEMINGTRVVGVETRKPLENGVRIGIIDHLIKPEEIFIPSSLLYIGDFAFYQCSLRRVTIPQSVRSIGRFAFGKNPELRNIEIPSNVDIKEGGFEYGFLGLYSHMEKKGGSYVISFVENDQWSYAIWSYDNTDYLVILKYKGTSAAPVIPASFNQTKVFAVLKDSGVTPPPNSGLFVW